MKQEILEIAKQYQVDCSKDVKHVSNSFHYISFNTDDTVGYRKSLPYVVSNVEKLVVINMYGFKAVAYYTGNDYIAYSSQSLCLSDDGDSETITIDGWTLKFFGMEFIWNQGDWPKLELQKDNFKYEIIFRNYEAMVNNWSIVKLFMEAEGPKHLELLLKPYLEKNEIVENGYYKIQRS